MIKNSFKMALILTAGLVLINCSGDDGTNGINGAPGAPGAPGIDGIDGLGFDDLTKYGSITATLSGTRIDDVPFSQTTEFSFTPVAGEEISDYNSVYFDEDNISFSLRRFLSSPGATFQDNSIEFILEVNDAGLTSQSINFLVGLNKHSIIGEDLKYFSIDRGWWSYETPAVLAAEVTDYSFDDTTNELSFSYTMSINEGDNETMNELTISGEVNVIVLESLITQTLN